MAGYHSPADTPDRVEAAAMTAPTRLVVDVVWFAAIGSATVSSLIGDRR
jgi:aminopeptidase YwaD